MPSVHRTPPSAPTSEALGGALSDIEAGRVTTTRWIAGEAVATASLTRTFTRQWRDMGLDPDEKLRVHHACVLVGHGRSHPALPAHTVPGYPNLHMVSPTPGVTVTFQPHPHRGDRVLFCTLTRG